MKKKKAALAACSDPISQNRLSEIYQIADILKDEGVDVVIPAGLFDLPQPSSRQKAKLLMDCFRDPDISYMYDEEV